MWFITVSWKCRLSKQSIIRSLQSKAKAVRTTYQLSRQYILFSAILQQNPVAENIELHSKQPDNKSIPLNYVYTFQTQFFGNITKILLLRVNKMT